MAMPEQPRRGMSRGAAIVLVILFLAIGLGAGWYYRGTTVTPEPVPKSVIERIYRNGEMVVGTDAAFPPFENVNTTTGRIEGFDIDLINEVAKFMGVSVRVVNTGWDPLFIQIPAKTLDMGISAMTITDDRNQTLLFSDPYFISDLSIVVRKNGPMEGVISQPADLQGRRIAFQEFTTSDTWVNDTLITTMGINPSEVRKTVAFTDAIQLLLADQVDAVIIDKPVGEGYESAGSVTLVYTIVTNETFGIPMPKGELALKAVVDAALEFIRESGKYAELIQKWFVG